MWKPVQFNPKYEISDQGQVRKIGGSELRIFWNLGYQYVNFNCRSYAIHRLVATHFLENPNHYRYIFHVDGNKSNNSASNLRWASGQENMKNIRNLPNYTESCRNSHAVLHVESGKTYPSIKSAYQEIRKSIEGPFIYERLRQSILKNSTYCGVTLRKINKS